MQKTLQALTVDTERMLYQAAGINTQVYAQDVIMQKLQHAFDNCFTAEWWPSFIRREARTLDGATGKTTAPFNLIREWKDVNSVFRRNSQHPLPTMPLSYNLLDLSPGATARFLEPSNDATLFTVYPLGSVDDIVVVGRERPINEFIGTDIVPFDNLALCYYAAWDYLVDDASNAGAAAKMQGLFNARMDALKDAEFDNIVLLNPRSEQIPSQWY
jgi:hypothetical protein